MIKVKIKKGWQFRIIGKPAQRIEHRPPISYVAVRPEKAPFVKPRLLVKKGDKVKIGSTLFEDKKNTALKFLSPGCGQISEITYGPRRIIEEIVIAIDENESYESFNAYTDSDIHNSDRQGIVSALMSGGMWPFIRQLPFREIADPDETPNAVWVSLGSADPFQPDAGVYLSEHQEFFEFGLKAIRRLVGTVNICWYDKPSEKSAIPPGVATHRVYGKYPASDAGVVLYHTKKSTAENRDWYIDGQDLILIGKFLKTGFYPTERIVAYSDGRSENSCHLKTRMGIRLKDLATSGIPDENRQWIVGGIFSGYTSGHDQFLDMYSTSVMTVKEAHESEMFGFVRPGLNKLSNSRTVLSALTSAPLPINTDLHGEKRPCVNCGYCTKICPVDIMPQYTFKSIYADEIEEALQYGLLDCVECGLCSFVCPSKIELSDYLIKAKHSYHKELNQIV